MHCGEQLDAKLELFIPRVATDKQTDTQTNKNIHAVKTEVTFFVALMNLKVLKSSFQSTQMVLTYGEICRAVTG